jgi:hypothetical protein
MTDRIHEMMDNLNSYLYDGEFSKLIKESSIGKISSNLGDECEDWMLLFKYLRISGIQKKECKDPGYEMINFANIRNSPYLYYPCSGDYGLEARGFQLGEEAFRASKGSPSENNSDASKLNIHSDLEDIMQNCIPQHNIW